MTLVLIAASVMLGTAALLTVIRLTIGPTILDRSVALDVLMAVTICGIAVYSAHRHTTYALPVLVVLAMVGFVGSVSIARYASGTDDVEAEDDNDDHRGHP
ncbi:monovalent cation/H+ antiporter complex subunit F [Nocardioides sp. zg-DK7169]|uniref:monovalent cation/H+ antiporter complex subunit F n=1 Tax=Nocardioides sp. zg-DK7169 TaxID=2736600 RepID=UPI001552E2D9|nr:monovalent cation/H+ antiporter complex subunit F [Nocardioides sp. zg-DK7169]NPC97081.1 cation:proton antiporter [Nocardioides sp. zg-DK7169]